MKVSIVTVSYNSASVLETAISSVLNQTYDDIEYIVIDGGSTDGTGEILESYKSFIDILVSEPDNGIYDAMNKGISMATGDIVAILNSDDFYIHNHVIEEVVSTFKNNTEIDVLSFGVLFVSCDDKFSVIRRYPSYGFSKWMLRFGFMPAHPGTFIKKSVYNDVGLYSTEFKIVSDFDWFIRFFHGFNFTYRSFDSFVVKMRIGGISSSGFKSYFTTTIEQYKSLKNNHIYTNYFLLIARLPIKFLQKIFK